MLALDSSAVIHYFKGAGRVVENLQRTAPHELAIPAVVLYELEAGVARLRQVLMKKAFRSNLVEAGVDDFLIHGRLIASRAA